MSVSGVFSDLNNLVLKRQSYTSVAEEAYIINQQGLTETDPCPQKMFGDANCDSEIEFNDFWVLKGEYFNSAILKKPAPFNGWNSDFDQNGKVDLNDFSHLARDWGKNGTSGEFIGDITGPLGLPDGKVDGFDLERYVRDYLKDINDIMP